MLKQFLTSLLNRRKESKLTFEDGVVFYNYVFDLGPDTNPIVIGRKLLKTNYARALTNYSTGKIELSELFQTSFSMRREVSQFTQFSETFRDEGLRGAIPWLLRHPLFTFGMAARLYKHRSEKEETPEDSEQPREKEPRDKNKTVNSMNDLLSEMDERILNVQKGLALHRFSDSEFFSQPYLEDLPFVRLDLYPVDVTFGEQELKMDVGLLIHRTGISILTFYAVLSGQRTVDDLLRLQILRQIRIDKVRVPDAVMGISAVASGVASPKSIKRFLQRETKRGSSEGYEIDFTANASSDEHYSLRDVFELYRLAIVSTTTGRSPEHPQKFWSKLRSTYWRAYPIFFLRPADPSIRNATMLKKRYSSQLAGLVGGTHFWRRLTTPIIAAFIKDDHSLTESQSFYIGLSHSTVIYYPESEDAPAESGKAGPMIGTNWIFRHFQRSSLIDILLIQQSIFQVLSHEIRSLPSHLKRLNDTKKNLLLALEEYHQFIVTTGSAGEIIKKGQEALLIKDAYTSIQAVLAILEKIIEVEESKRRYRRDLALRWVATAATLFLGLPGAKQVVLVFGSWKIPTWTEYLPFLGTLIHELLRFAQHHPNQSTAIVYGVLIVTILPVLFWSARSGSQKKTILSLNQSASGQLQGFTWPSELEFVRGDQP
jgi:hypothetical protein